MTDSIRRRALRQLHSLWMDGKRHPYLESATAAQPAASDAVLRNLQVLGEAANNVPDRIRLMGPDIEWERIIRSRCT